jgi:signal transduction histidine kinase
MTPSSDLTLRALHHQLEQAQAEQARLREHQQAQMAYFAAAAHDLRQPLHALALHGAYLAMANRDAALQPALRQVQACVAALDSAFAELLDLARIDLGGAPAHLQACSLAPLFERLRLNFGVIAFDKGLALGLRGAAHVVLADPRLLERVLSNLLANAIRHTDDGGVLVACRRRGAGRVLQVWDSGCGIAAEQLGRIFEPFHQVPRRAGEALQPGLGLGLTIARRLAQQMGGTLTVRSRPSHGTVFELLLQAPPG